MTFFKKIKGGIYHGIGFILVLGITGVAYGAYITLSNVESGETLTASSYNQLITNVSTIKTTLDGVSTQIVPAGFVGAFNLSTCPTGWIAANGSNGTPDLRGTFIRGMNGDANGRDVSRALGNYQVDDFKSHIHSNASVYGSAGSSIGALGFVTAGSLMTWGGTTPTGGTETRPENIALLYCVKQ